MSSIFYIDIYTTFWFNGGMTNKQPKFVSRIPELMREKGIKQVDIIRAANLSGFTAARLARGDLNVSVTTLMRLCPLFGVDDIGFLVRQVADDAALEAAGVGDEN